MDGYEIRSLRDEDIDALLEAWNAVFRADTVGARLAPRTRAEWSWAFDENPAGRRVHVAVHDGRVAAHYAALPVRVLFDGRERIAGQIVDSFVHPAHRGGLKRPGIFVQTARAFFDAHGGRNADVLYYGWPVPEARRVGERLLAYTPVREELFLGREIAEREFVMPQGVATIERFDEQARWLYDRCCGAFALSTVRDAEYLNWRFVDAPRGAYRCLGVRDERGILRGYAVLRVCDFLMPRMGVIVDWLVAVGDDDVADRLLTAALATFAAHGARTSCTLVPPWSPWFAWFQERGFRAHASDHLLCARSFTAELDLDELRDGWWYQLADCDLV